MLSLSRADFWIQELVDIRGVLIAGTLKKHDYYENNVITNSASIVINFVWNCRITVLSVGSNSVCLNIGFRKSP